MIFFRALFLCVLFLAGTAFMPGQLSFEETQQKNDRVRQAYERKEEYIKMKCRKVGIPEETFGNMFIRAFKAEAIMEIWVQKPDGDYVKLDQFNIYAESGKLGPKRMQGDCQVPEGYYYINDFNPNSNYYLSLGISYPNESDMKLSTAANKGGLIYIHGKHASAGCLAMSDYYVEDIYICAVKARNYGQQKIPVQIFPFKPTEENFTLFNQYVDCAPFNKLWRNMAEGYNLFEKTHHLPKVTVANNGFYQFSDAEIAAAK
jgi:murein L,D-transpeptidase YafK